MGFDDSNAQKMEEATSSQGLKTPQPTSARKSADLRELMRESIEAPTSVPHLSAEEYAAIDAQREELGRSLADKLYELTNVTRETNLSTYIETINDVVLEKGSEENQVILAVAQSYFVEMYGAKIRSLGHSPILLDQIVHRTGKETREIVAKTLQGFNVGLISAQIREHELTFSEDTAKLAARLMYDLTHEQVRELRQEYTKLPGKEIAALLHHALNRKDLRGKPYPDADRIRYILMYRTAKEVAQIECQFNEMYHFDRTQHSELCLREQIKEKFPESKAGLLLSLLEGFQPSVTADAIYALLSDCARLTEGLENPVALKNDFAGLFRKKNQSIPVWQKEIAARSAIEHVVAELSMEQFQQVNTVLKQHYDIELTPELYPSLRPFNARERAMHLYSACLRCDPRAEFRRAEQYLSEAELHEVKDEFRLSKENELSAIIRAKAEEKKALEALRHTAQALQPIAFLQPEELRQVRLVFPQISGSDFDTFIQETVLQICREDIPTYVSDYVFLLLSGTGRQSLHRDIFSIFANKEQRTLKNAEETSRQRMIAQIPTITKMLESNAAHEGSALFELLAQYTTADLHMLERIFGESSDTHVPLLKALELCQNNVEMLKIELLFKGINIHKLVEEIHTSPLSLKNYLRLHADYIQLLNTSFQERYDISLDSFIEKTFSERTAKQQQELAHAMLFYYAPTAACLHELCKQCSEDSVHQEQLLALFEQNKKQAKILECCFNLYYQEFYFSYTREPSSFLRNIRILTSAGSISRDTCAKLLLLLEHLPSTVTQRLHSIFSDRSLSAERLQEAHSILREHRTNVLTIKRAYNVLDPQYTLRETLYQLQLPLDTINKTILISDGYDPDAFALKISKLVEDLAGEPLGSAVVQLLLHGDTSTNTMHIPTDHNWTTEMYHQIRRSYEEQFSRTIIGDLLLKDCPLKGLGVNKITHLLYGEVSKVAVDLYRELYEKQTPDSKKILALLEHETPRLRARAIAMFDAYFTKLRNTPSFFASVQQKLPPESNSNSIFHLIQESVAILNEVKNLSE